MKFSWFLLFSVSFSIFTAAKSGPTGEKLGKGKYKEYIIEFGNNCDHECHKMVLKAAEECGCKGCLMDELGSAAVSSESWMKISCMKGGSPSASMIKTKLRSFGINIRCVEEDQEGEIQNDIPWNVQEVIGQNGVRRRRCGWSLLGDSVLLFILDTGCIPRGKGFDAIKCRNYVGDYTKDYCRDGHSHGRHVAGIATSKKFGVAPYADLACLRVLGDNGRGSFSNFIRAINDVARYSMTTWKPCVVNLSLAGGRSMALNDAVKAAAKAGVRIVIASGNQGKDAKNYSPVSATDNKWIFAVGAHDRNGKRGGFSNYGDLVKLTAPGVSITSDAKTTGSRQSTGTSMAAPHVAGAIATLLSDGEPVTLENLQAKTSVTYPSGVKGETVKVHKAKYRCFFW